MKTSCSIKIILAALLLNATILSHSQKLKRSHGLPLDILERTHPRDILIGVAPSRPPIPVGRIQPKNVDDCDDELRKPTRRDLNKKRLRKKLRGNIDERFLSISKPAHLSDSPIVERVLLRGVTTSEKDFLKRVIRNETVPRMGKVPVFVEKFLMKWLIHKSDCPVEHTWIDQGMCYWPRWISMGRCINKQCSWPQGMSCVASDPVDVYLLRWHCHKNRQGGRKGKRTVTQTAGITCRWLKFKRSVINDCKCKCDKTSSEVEQKLLPVPVGN